MSASDVDPNLLMPIWQALVRYFRAHPPVVHAPQQLGEQRIAANDHAGKHGRVGRRSRSAAGKVTKSPRFYLSKDLEKRLPIQPSP